MAGMVDRINAAAAGTVKSAQGGRAKPIIEVPILSTTKNDIAYEAGYGTISEQRFLFNVLEVISHFTDEFLTIVCKDPKCIKSLYDAHTSRKDLCFMGKNRKERSAIKKEHSKQIGELLDVVLKTDGPVQNFMNELFETCPALKDKFLLDFSEYLIKTQIWQHLDREKLSYDFIWEDNFILELRNEALSSPKTMKAFEKIKDMQPRKKTKTHSRRKAKGKLQEFREAATNGSGKTEKTKGKKAETAKRMRRARTDVTTVKTEAPRARDAKPVEVEVPKIDVKRLPKVRG